MVVAADNSFLNSVDAMDLTSLHVLSCNPNATLGMIREIASKCPDVAMLETKSGSYPVDVYLLTKNIVQGRCNYGKLKYDQSDKIRCLMKRGIHFTIHDLIKSSLRYDDDLWDIILAFQGTSVDAEPSTHDNMTRLHAYMTAAVANDRPLHFVYKMAMLDPTI